MINATSGRVLVNKTQPEVQSLIATITVNSQQFGTRSNPQDKVNDNTNSHLEKQLNNLTTLVQYLAIKQVKNYGICSTVRCHIDICSIFQALRPAYDSYYNIYNALQRDHPNLSYSNNNQSTLNNQSSFSNPRPPHQYKSRTHPPQHL